MAVARATGGGVIGLASAGGCARAAIGWARERRMPCGARGECNEGELPAVRQRRPLAEGPGPQHPSLDRLRDLQGGRLRGHGRGGGSLRLQRQGRALHGRHRRALVRQHRLWPGGDGAGDRRPGAPHPLLLDLHAPDHAAGRGACGEACRARAGLHQPRLLRHRRVDGERHRHPRDSLLFQPPGQADQEEDHLACRRLSRLDIPRDDHDRGQVRPRRLRPRARPRAPHPGAAHVPAAGRHERGRVLRREGSGPREQDPGARAGERRLLHRRADHGRRRRDRASARLPRPHQGGVREVRGALHLGRGGDRIRGGSGTSLPRSPSSTSRPT